MPDRSEAGLNSPHPGDTRQRITVPKPKSLSELQNQAAKHFGASRSEANMKMFHGGEQHIQNQGHFENVKHNDVVVVSAEQFERMREAFATTTHQDCFVRHPTQARKMHKQEAKDNGPSLPFEGTTSYNVDYVNHPVKPRPPMKPKDNRDDAPRIPLEFGDSMYKSSYPWHKQQPREKQAPKEKTVGPPTRFEGTTSYKNDYVTHAQRPRSAVVPRNKDNGPSIPFEGYTTYNNDYKKHKAGYRPVSAKQDRKPTGPGVPFEGTTEYQNEYLRRALPRKEYIHLEPEVKSPVDKRERRRQ